MNLHAKCENTFPSGVPPSGVLFILHKKYPEKEGELKFYEIVKDLQDKNEGYLVLVRSGIFFVGVGKDAVILQNITTLKPVCLKEGICKCGIPVITFDKFIHNLKKENDIAVVIYDYNKEDINKYKEIARIEGKKVYETNKCKNCKERWYSKNRIVKELDIIEKIIEMCKEVNNEKK